MGFDDVLGGFVREECTFPLRAELAPPFQFLSDPLKPPFLEPPLVSYLSLHFFELFLALVNLVLLEFFQVFPISFRFFEFLLNVRL